MDTDFNVYIKTADIYKEKEVAKEKKSCILQKKFKLDLIQIMNCINGYQRVKTKLD